jgi:glycosyltransferase involved in cell wall biosynthesis
MTADVDRVIGRRITQRIALPALCDSAAAPTPARGRLIVAAGRLVPEKGFDLALLAFAALDDPAASLAILGEGPELGRLRDLALELGVADRVAFPGYVADVRPWLDRARLFLLSSWYEGYGAVVVEALAAGRPVVATDCTPAAYELLDCLTAGAVAPLGDVSGLALCLHHVLNAPAPCPQALSNRVAGYRIGPIADAYLHQFDAVKAQRDARAARGVSFAALWPVSAYSRATGSRPRYAAALHPAK